MKQLHNSLCRYFGKLVLLCLLNWSCQEHSSPVSSEYKYIKPDYSLIQLQPTTDTLHFPLSEDTYNSIKSFNVFSSSSTEYISFYDQRSESINTYLLKSGILVKKILLKNIFKGKQLYKTTVYCKSFDSIFITNKTSLYLLNSRGKVKKMIDFLEKPPLCWAFFDNTNPPLFKGRFLYMSVRPYVKENSLSALRNWKVLYKFDLKEKKAYLDYHLPQLYHKGLYGYRLLDYNYCINNKGRFVFSFPADSNLYESDLDHYNMAYFAKSRFHDDAIPPVSKKELENGEDKLKSYLIRDSYGSVYFDPVNRRYLRLAKRRISLADYQTGNRRKEQRIIIFDDQFKIIGESSIDNDIMLSELFFTGDSGLFARTQVKDEYALHFVKLAYKDVSGQQMKLAKKNNYE